MRNHLKNLSVHYQGDYNKIKWALEHKVDVPNYEVMCDYVCIGEKYYPKALYELTNPPFVLYFRGNIDILNKNCISIVGSREPSIYAIKCTKKLVENLREDYCIVSGIAIGIDRVAHEVALDFSTVAVLGFGVDVIYPKGNQDIFNRMYHSQCVISEYPPGTKPLQHHFPNRNRIIAALGQSLYVMSAKLRSGTMHTVNAALRLNKHIICLPHPIDDESGAGCNQLILEGADILTSLDKV